MNTERETSDSENNNAFSIILPSLRSNKDYLDLINFLFNTNFTDFGCYRNALLFLLFIARMHCPPKLNNWSSANVTHHSIRNRLSIVESQQITQTLPTNCAIHPLQIMLSWNREYHRFVCISYHSNHPTTTKQKRNKLNNNTTTEIEMLLNCRNFSES